MHTDSLIYHPKGTISNSTIQFIFGISSAPVKDLFVEVIIIVISAVWCIGTSIKEDVSMVNS